MSATYQLGQRVAVKRHGVATITQLPPDDAAHQFYGRYQVTYIEDGKTYYARPGALRPLVYPPQRVLVCDTTKHYRAAALMYALPTDVVLEVGCHEGVTTDILHARCKWVLGIDKRWDPVARARGKYPHCQLEKMDGFDIDALRAKSPTGTYDKIFIDIGGIAELHVVMSLLGLYHRTFRSTYLIVKSKYLKNLMGQMQVWAPPGQQPKQSSSKPQMQQPIRPCIDGQLDGGSSDEDEDDDDEQEQQLQQQTTLTSAARDKPPLPVCSSAGEQPQQQQHQQSTTSAATDSPLVCGTGKEQQQQRRQQQQQQQQTQ